MSFSMELQREIQKNTTVYNFDTIDVDGKPEVQFKCLKRLVGERGFEPPTPWSRTRCSTRLSHSPTRAGRNNESIHPHALLLDRQCRL
jgi:hypothetical protein